jgi:hypothetical protein
MVKPVAPPAGQPGRTVGRWAAGAAASLTTPRSSSADRSGIGGVASFGGAWLSLRRGLVAGTDGEAAEPGVDVTAAWATVVQTRRVKTSGLSTP